MTTNEMMLDGERCTFVWGRLRDLSIGAVLVATLSGCATTGSMQAEQQNGEGTLVTAAAEASDVVEQEAREPRRDAQRQSSQLDSYVVFGKRYYVKDSGVGHVEQGLASWYGRRFHGRRTSSGERYDMYALTAAHKSLPLPTYAEVTNLDNGRSVLVKINDRGPFVDERVIDLSYGAARELAMVGAGVARVEVRAIDPAVELASGGREANGAGQNETIGSVDQVDRQAVRLAGSTQAAERGAAGVGKLYVRVGEFGDRANAEQLRQRLLDHLAEQVEIRSGGSGGPRPYQLQVGPLATPEQAQGVSQELAALGLARARTVEE